MKDAPAKKDLDKRATDLLRGKVVSKIVHRGDREILIEFSDGTRFFVNSTGQGLEASITGGKE
jgi:putative component of toxin-antitoxin plasmid stabilization module